MSSLVGTWGEKDAGLSESTKVGEPPPIMTIRRTSSPIAVVLIRIVRFISDRSHLGGGLALQKEEASDLNGTMNRHAHRHTVQCFPFL